MDTFKGAKGQRERCASGGLVSSVQLALVVVGNCQRDRQSESRSVAVCSVVAMRVETFEDPSELVRLDSRALVADGERRVGTLCMQLDCHRGVCGT